MDKKQLVTEMRRTGLAVCSDGKWCFNVPSALMHSVTRPIIASLLNSEIGKVSNRLKPEPIIGGIGLISGLLVQIVHGFTKSFLFRKHGDGSLVGWPVHEGQNVILVTDVINTGRSIVPCIRHVVDCGGVVKAIVPVIDLQGDNHLGKHRRCLVKPISTKDDYKHWSDDEKQKEKSNGQ